MLDPQELELQTVVNHLTWILGTELRSGKSVSTHVTSEPSLSTSKDLLFFNVCVCVHARMCSCV